MTLVQGVLSLLCVVGIIWFVVWIWNQIPTVQCSRCFSYDVAPIEEVDGKDYCECGACGYKFLA